MIPAARVAPRRVVIIQARMSSSRLPGKVLMDLAGLPMVVFMVDRVRRASLADAVVVATSTDASDDPLAVACAAHGIDCFRGSLDDVLDRFHGAAQAHAADHVVRLTGDCPLMDADLVDHALAELAAGGWDYVSNSLLPTYPDGLDVEAFTMAALVAAWSQARLPSEREHVTPWMRQGQLRTTGISALADFSALRWTVDHADDLDHVRSLVAACADRGPAGFDRFDLYRAIEQGAVAGQAHHQRNEGYARSLAAEGRAPSSNPA